LLQAVKTGVNREHVRQYPKKPVFSSILAKIICDFWFNSTEVNREQFWVIEWF
jgi:hypothetical protein